MEKVRRSAAVAEKSLRWCRLKKEESSRDARSLRKTNNHAGKLAGGEKVRVWAELRANASGGGVRLQLRVGTQRPLWLKHKRRLLMRSRVPLQPETVGPAASNGSRRDRGQVHPG